MSYPINYPTPQNCNTQIFYGLRVTQTSGVAQRFAWAKPKGASFVWFTLIGAGGRGGDGNDVSNQGGGGSGAVTNCLMPAFLVPDKLRITMSTSSVIFYAGPKASSAYELLSANGGANGTDGTGGNGGSAAARTAFAAAGVYQSVAGQAGSVDASVSRSDTTFLGGGTYAATVTPNYGYPSDSGVGSGAAGFFQLSPIILGRGGTTGNSTPRPGGIGCGGSGSALTSGTLGGAGGPGMVVIISW
jgi:hypothetical protein